MTLPTPRSDDANCDGSSEENAFTAHPPALRLRHRLLRRRGVYALPTLFTLGAMFGGFYAIVMAMNTRFELATAGLFAAMVFDGLDGRIARLTHTQSAFGEQMDSLADMVSFGAAPALIAYEWSLKELGRWGWAAAFVYCACAAIRLARFNVTTAITDKHWFQGLPSPSAAAMVVFFVWLVDDVAGGAHGQSVGIFSWSQISWLTFAITLYAGLTMATNAPFYSFKAMRLPLATIVLIVILIAAINIHPPLVMFVMSVIYGLSGYAIYGWRKAKGLPASIISTSTDEPDEQGLHQ